MLGSPVWLSCACEMFLSDNNNKIHCWNSDSGSFSKAYIKVSLMTKWKNQGWNDKLSGRVLECCISHNTAGKHSSRHGNLWILFFYWAPFLSLSYSCICSYMIPLHRPGAVLGKWLSKDRRICIALLQVQLNFVKISALQGENIKIMKFLPSWHEENRTMK